MEYKEVEYIYHYCSPSTFLSIIKHKELWLTSLTQSNDSAEGDWMLEAWLKSFDRNCSSQKMRARGARLLVNSTRRDLSVLGTCFSEEGDLLSQWRGYAADGAGFSIAFKR